MDGSIFPLYADWKRYNDRIIDGLRPLTPADLALEVGTDHWPVYAIVGHVAGARVFWLCSVFGEPGADTTPFPDPATQPGWEDDLSLPPPSPAEVVEAMTSTWRIVEATLRRWTPDILQETAERRTSNGVQLHTRQSVLVRLITHDAYHAGEIALTLGSNGRTGFDLWPAALPPAPLG